MNECTYLGRICTDLVLNKKAMDDKENYWTRFRLAVARKRVKKEGEKDTDFSDDGNDNKWVDWLTMTVNNNAYYPIKKKPAEKDHIITLSTCSGKQKGDSYRFVVHSLVTDTVIYEE